jgi:hypothetical protein
MSAVPLMVVGLAFAASGLWLTLCETSRRPHIVIGFIFLFGGMLFIGVALITEADAQYLKTPGELISPAIKKIVRLSADDRQTVIRALEHNDGRRGIDDLLRARNHRVRDEISDPTFGLPQDHDITWGWQAMVTTGPLFAPPMHSLWTLANPHYLILRTGAMGWVSGIPTPMKPVMTGPVRCDGDASRLMKCRWQADVPLEFTSPELLRVREALSNDRYCRWEDQDDPIEWPSVRRGWMLRCHDWNEKANDLYQRIQKTVN